MIHDQKCKIFTSTWDDKGNLLTCGSCDCGAGTPEQDPVNHPLHYKTQTGMESIEVIEAFDFGFCLGNCFKYIARAGKKDPSKELEDLKKARWYLNRHIAMKSPK